MNYSKPKSANTPKPPATFAAAGNAKVVYGKGPSLGLKDCAKDPPPPKPIDE